MLVGSYEDATKKKKKSKRAQSAKVRSPATHGKVKQSKQEYILIPKPLPEESERLAQLRRLYQSNANNINNSNEYNGYSSVTVPKRLIASRMSACEFEPTKSYLYEEKKFKWDHQVKCDRVKKF